jgi:hypothetical protein
MTRCCGSICTASRGEIPKTPDLNLHTSSKMLAITVNCIKPTFKVPWWKDRNVDALEVAKGL